MSLSFGKGSETKKQVLNLMKSKFICSNKFGDFETVNKITPLGPFFFIFYI